MPQTTAFGQTIKWEWSHKLGDAQDFSDGKPKPTRLPLPALREGLSHVRLHSKDVNFGATLEFETTEGITAAGFANTIYSQVREWYYASAVDPASGLRFRETIHPLPIWDDGEDEPPWYARVDDDLGDEIFFNDAPNLPPYPGDDGVEKPNYPYGRLHLTGKGPLKSQHLFYITGREEYEAILIVQKGNQYAKLDSIPWHVVWDAEVVRGICIPAGGSGTYVNVGMTPQILVTKGRGSSKSKVDAAGIWKANAVGQTIQMAAKRLQKRQLWMIDAGR